ncbi:MAG: hypothetical protein IT320_10140 [Anaerolineae bacterium]|nr:hypothetical protein [Anaerolineae bacterium]
MQRFRSLSTTSRSIFWLILALLLAGLLYAIFSTQLGQTALIVCCGGGLLIVVIGVLSEAGMRKPR